MKTNISIRKKMFIPIAVQILVLIVLLLIFISASRDVYNKIQISNSISDSMMNLKSLQEISKENYLAPNFPEEKRATFMELHGKLTEYQNQNSADLDSVQMIMESFNTIQEQKSRNRNIESEIIDVSFSSMEQSDGYIRMTVSNLMDPINRSSVTNLERQVILGAGLNTSSNWAIQKLFYKMAFDINAKEELLEYLNTALNNVENDIVNLANTPFAGMPIAAKESNNQIKKLVEEYVSNIELINITWMNTNSFFNYTTEHLDNSVKTVKQDVLDAVRIAFLKIGVVTILFSILIAFLNSVMGVRISSSINYIVKTLQDISEGDGDLTQRLKTDAQDELGKLAIYFNKTIDSIESMILSIKNESHNLSKNGSELSASMTETAAAVNQISANITGVKNQTINQSEAVSTTSASQNEILQNITDLLNSVDDLASSVEQSSSSTRQMIKNLESVSEILDQNAFSFQDLMSASEEGKTGIDNVADHIKLIKNESEGLISASKVIEEIASQTNLLAMNAAIEAAHAGDSGKGFAVVADEIRKLAENSGVQAKSISNVLIRLKESIDRVSESSVKAQNQFDKVVNLTNTVNSQEKSIKNVMDEQNTGSSDLLSAIRNMTDITEKVKISSNLMEEDGKTISKEMQSVSQITDAITSNMNEMETGTNEINLATQDVSRISKETTESILILSKEISKFIVSETEST